MNSALQPVATPPGADQTVTKLLGPSYLGDAACRIVIIAKGLLLESCDIDLPSIRPG